MPPSSLGREHGEPELNGAAGVKPLLPQGEKVTGLTSIQQQKLDLRVSGW